MKHKDLTDNIINRFYHVYNTLGYGFLEKVYHQALLIALKKSGLHCETEYPISVFFEGQNIGTFSADIIVERSVILELKAVTELHPIHEVQLVNYLRATNIEVGLLLNFGLKPDIKRKAMDNNYKKSMKSV